MYVVDAELGGGNTVGDEEIWKAVRVRAARTGQRDGDVVEAALRRDLGFDLLERLWERNDLDEDEAMDLALEAQVVAKGAKNAKKR